MELTTIAMNCKDTADHDRRVLNHIGLAKAIAHRIHQTLPVHVELDDLFHAGVIGLLDAAKKYDATRRVDFSTYAKHRIRGAILDSLRQLDTASRDLRRRWKQIETARVQLRALLERDPTEAEIADHLEMDIEKFRKTALEARAIGEVSTNIPSQLQDGLREHEFEGPPASQPDFVFAKVELRSILGSAMNVLRPRQQQVMRLYYAGHKTMKEIGVSLGVNESRVSQLHKSALSALRLELQARGVLSEDDF